MSARKKYKWPSDEDLIALINSMGRAGAAKQIGCPPGTLSSRIHYRGLGKQLTEVVTAPDPSGPVSEVEMLQQRVRELETHTRSHRKAEVFDERVATAIEAALGDRKPRYSPQAIPKSKRSKTKQEFALLWSDLHAGEVVSEEETNGINSYDWDTMLERHGKLREALLSYQDSRSYPVDKLHIWALGDMLSGDIHDELVTTNEIPLAEATVQLGLDGAEWIESLNEGFPEIHFAGVVGNHPRAHKKPWAKQGYDNADWTTYNIMRLALRRNKNITFEIPKANQHRVQVADRWHSLLWHGDSVRSSMPGVPWGGIVRRVTSLKAQYNEAGKPCDLFCCGHFHTANAVEGGTVNVNGSVKGVDEYSLKAFGGGRPPQQILLAFHPERGLTDVSFLDCI